MTCLVMEEWSSRLLSHRKNKGKAGRRSVWSDDQSRFRTSWNQKCHRTVEFNFHLLATHH
jgi:hypothetical protein